MMALNNLHSAMSRRRPKRQRNPTTIYSDDRPNTFATKRWKGQVVYGPEPESVAAASPAAPISSPSIAINKRGPGRPTKKKSLEFPPQPRETTTSTTLSNGNKTTSSPPSTRPVVSLSSSVGSAASSSSPNDNLSIPSLKRKRGRPPKSRSTESDEMPAIRSPSSPFVAKAPPTTTTATNGGPPKAAVVLPSTTKIGTRSNPLQTPPPALPKASAASATKRRKSDSVLRRRRSLSHNNSHAMLMRTPSWTQPQDDLEGTFLNHPVTLAPILPPILKHDNVATKESSNTTDDVDRKALQTRYPAVFNEGGIPKACTAAVAPFSSTSQSANATMSSSKNQQLSQASQLPSWTPLLTPPVYFEDDYDRETGQLDVDNILPVTRSITALTVRKPHHDYLALGDSAGFVLIYSLDRMQRPVARLESAACQQRARSEQERLRAELSRKRTKKSSGSGGSVNKKFTKTKGLALLSSSSHNHIASGPQSSSSILIDTSDTTIHALGMIGERVVLATSVELECMDVPSATSLWVCPLSSNRFVTSLDMHLKTYNVLVSCSKEDIPSPSVQVQQPSSLMLLQHSKNNVEICDANSPMLVRSPSCTAIWDVGCDNRLMFVALSGNRQELELVLVSGGSIEQWKVACKTKIPIKSSGGSASNNMASSQTRLTQSFDGEYTLVASSRGIRLYQTESLQLIHVYGDQLSLHGQSVIWKDCWLAGSFFNEGKHCHKSGSGAAPRLEIDDWLAYSNGGCSKKSIEEEKDSISAVDLPPYIVGVPHTKGPKELVETLHVWKVEHASVVPSLSIPLPPKSEGALGLVVGGNGSTTRDSRILLVTNDGQGHAMVSKMESNFAGIMYPPGYQVITDNIEFVEEEDALDEVVHYDDLSDANSQSEDEEINIFDQVEEDDMDEELKEAMRQSLLEHQRQEEARAAMSHDQDVNILLHNLNTKRSFLPCRPEPYLRQFIHTPEDDDEDEEEVIGATKPLDEKVEKSAKVAFIAEKEELSNGASFVANVLEALPNMEKPLPVEDEDCLSFTTTKVVVAVNPVPIVPTRPGRGRKSRAGNLEAMLKASVNPYLQSRMLGQQGVPSDGSGSYLPKRISEDPKPALSQVRDGASSNGTNTGHTTPDPKSTTADEAAVALGLLGLSPTPGVTPAKSMYVLAGVLDGNGPAYLNASTLSSLPTKAGPGVHGTVGNLTGGTAESLTTSSDPGSGTEESIGDFLPKPKAHIPCKFCHACRGRHVIHTCGKRSLPIDYDEVAKAERERKEKEEEEKKRLRAEKRRLADQRRREAKKQKQRELEEQRLREEGAERREKERRRRLQEDFASQDLNDLRTSRIVASYAQYQEQGPLEMSSVDYSQPRSMITTTEVISPAVLSAFEEVSRPRVGSIFEQASRMMEDSSARKPAPAIETSAIYADTANTNGNATAYTDGAVARAQGYTTPAPLSIPPAPAPTASNPFDNASMASAAAQLEALDGLAALAELARVTPAAVSKPTSAPGEGLSSFSYAVAAVAPSTQEPENSFGSFSYAASHGFGEVKKGIPSYATIRGQSNTGTTPMNGGVQQEQQQKMETCVWPPRREPQD